MRLRDYAKQRVVYVARCLYPQQSTLTRNGLCADAVPGGSGSRPTGSNPFHPSGDLLAAILALLSRRLQFLVPLGVNLRLTPSEHAVLVLTIIDPQK
jgi:hypothetical protein